VAYTILRWFWDAAKTYYMVLARNHKLIMIIINVHISGSIIANVCKMNYTKEVVECFDLS